MKPPCIIIGGGLSGLAAAIRLARYIPGIVLLEQHTRLGGLNSYYYRNNTLLETGLHAITNYAEPGDKRAPLNRLLRQLKIPRKNLTFHQQITSEIIFAGKQRLLFSNDFVLLQEEIADKFPDSIDAFFDLLNFLDQFDPFAPAPFRSAKAFLLERLADPLLVDMLLCPLMYYGSSVENDMDLSQFAIMFQAIYREGFFRPHGTIRDFLTLLSDHFLSLGGEIRRGAKVTTIIQEGKRAIGVELESGEILESDFILSTIGHQETRTILGQQPVDNEPNRLGFVESIFQLPVESIPLLPRDRTVMFYSENFPFSYNQPVNLVDCRSGVICLPHNFDQITPEKTIEVRSTHLASYSNWQAIRADRLAYDKAKKQVRQQSLSVIEKYLGKFRDNIVYEDTFTPITIERYTAKRHGAIYGSPIKIKDGNIGYDNLYLAGTDQGFLGIVGSMLSGVSIVNQHILPRI
ncbi:phytoene desaturase family protein [Desulfopila aestuarii]|uniref:Phytoene dehydrogenase-related protein n=1 Tax=Desulfopila aestuarii DSM 18488 TaxID=1121416 RepID=A0A1M7Y213_9BACT|nr:NAD(P)/FAD-dependent oxidoreductase [Desulfopila aestuarii]SHO45878.1 Phytoene dehydrogenase-related protein [Desulfopila aestuarii DSM 18488]